MRTVAPDPGWETPAQTWVDAIDRYVTFLQVPAWRASVRRDGSERSGCLTAEAAAALQRKMHRILDWLARESRVDRQRLVPDRQHLTDLWRLVDRTVPRGERCSSVLHWHFQRAFLLNASGYRCEYCHRSAWSVFQEPTGEASPRTLRFEVDHRTTRRRLTDPTRFDPDNLVIACRSCNTIKAEMTLERFELERRSLARAVMRKEAHGVS